MRDIYELGSSLQRLLSTLKKNHEHVPLSVLRTTYHAPYYQLIAQINETATAFAKAVVLTGLVLNPEVSLEEQVTVINQTIEASGLVKEMSRCMSRTYSVQALHQLALQLRKKVELALWPFIDQKTCLVADLDSPEQEPIIYNTLTHQVYEDGRWINRKINLQGKLLIYTSAWKETPEKKEESYAL